MTPLPLYLQPQTSPTFRPGYLTPSALQGPLSAFNQAGLLQQTRLDQAVIQQALSLLGQIRHLPGDEVHMSRLGVNPVFQNGQQALQVVQSKGIQVEFGDMGDSPAHAQWLADQNRIMLNQRYKGDTNPATLYALSEAIYHEAGHATGNGDGESSVQEELNCLALNTLAHRFHCATDPRYGQATSNNRLLSDGVALYARLFFDPDPQKQALIKRVEEKYGDLPLSSPGHEPPPMPYPQPGYLTHANTSPLAYRIKWQFLQKQMAHQALVSRLSSPSRPGRLPIPPYTQTRMAPPSSTPANTSSFLRFS